MRYQSIQRNRPGNDWDSAASAIYWGTYPKNPLNRPRQRPSVKHAGNRRGSWHHLEDRHLMGLVVVFLVLLAISTTAFAELDFELPEAHASGSGFVHLSTLAPKPTLINFWRSDCTPCLRELPLLNRYASEHPEIRIITIALQKPFETWSSPVLPKHPIISLHGPNPPQGLLARFGNRTGALPFSVMLDPQREACVRKTGEINLHWLESNQLACK